MEDEGRAVPETAIKGIKYKDKELKEKRHWVQNQLPFFFLVMLLLGMLTGIGMSYYFDLHAKRDAIKLGGVVIDGRPFSLTEIKKAP